SISDPLLLLSFSLIIPPPPTSTLFPYTTLFRSAADEAGRSATEPAKGAALGGRFGGSEWGCLLHGLFDGVVCDGVYRIDIAARKDRKSTRLNSSHVKISYAVFCLKKKKIKMSNY